ncbi:MAG: hypothetical protein JXM73_21800 [Anaerolineae bacterium]|nr:hypothetical protein [Anaerolineae bacterium]
MSLLIRDLVQFEPVEEVIKLRKEEKAREYVETYVISDSLRRNLLYMLELLSGPTHKSFNVVGNYGTGKSHFLAFVAALLEHSELRPLIRDEQVRTVAQALARRYLVVKFELGAAAETPLRRIFFDQVQRQLLDRYDIEAPTVDLIQDYDNKQNVLDVLAAIKAEEPEAGLVVIVDEISDFLKQKPRDTMTYDLNLLRELGEVSQDSDFLYIGAMQEHVFTNPKYVDQAESIARINQRFVTVTITKEDVARVLTERVVRKDADQRMQLQSLLGEHRQYFTGLADQFDRFVDLFPIHPYVIDVFERLPYFENRGVIGFAVNNVQALLDLPAPVFVTYDRVFDLINATHEIRNQPSVAEVVRVVQTLRSKADLLDPRYRDDAHKLIKALAVLNLLGGEHKNGATSQELANTLLITPPGRLLVQPDMATGHIERVMKNIRDVTVGQYIDYGAGRYYLDLTKIDDYDALIEHKAQAAVDEREVELTFRALVEAELGLKGQPSLVAGLSIFDDTAPWPSRRAFRPGVLVIGRQDDGANILRGDYRFVLQGPVPGKAVPRQDTLVLATDFTPELVALLTRARAAELLVQDGVHRKVMADLSKKAAGEFRDKYLAHLLAQGYAMYGGHRTNLSSLPSRRPLNTLSDVSDHVKAELLDGTFADKYRNHPIFDTLITAANLESEMTRALQSLDRMATHQLDLNSQGYLQSFGAMEEGHFSARHSPLCRLILERVEANDTAGKVTSLESLLRELAQPPWGLPQAMVYLLLGALLFNGYLVFVQQGGARLHAGGVGLLLKQGMSLFESIRYLERDKDIDVGGAVALFEALGLQAGLVRDKEERAEAVKALRLRGQELKGQLNVLRQGAQALLADSLNYPDVPWAAVQALVSQLAWLDAPVTKFANASRVSDLGDLDTSPDFRERLQSGLRDLQVLDSLLHDWREEGLGAGIRRMQDALTVLPQLESVTVAAAYADGQTAIVELRQIADDSRAIYADDNLLFRPDMRRPLKGKLEQFRQKYDQLYYGLHRRLVGDDAPWEQLDAVRASPRYAALNQLKSLPFVSPSEFNQVALDLQALEHRRCRQFNAQVLESFVTCPYCGFPDQSSQVTALPNRLEHIQARLDDLWQRWQEQLFNELPGLRDRLSLLSAEHRALIEDLDRRGALSESLSDELLSALHELTSDLQPVELHLAELGRALLAQGSALTVSELRNGLEAYLASLLKGYDPDLVRIKIVPE